MIGYKFFKSDQYVGGYQNHTKLIESLIQEDWIEIKEDEDCSKFSLIISHNFKRSEFKNVNCPFIQICHRPGNQDFDLVDDENLHYVTHYEDVLNFFKQNFTKTNIYFLPMVIEPFPNTPEHYLEIAKTHTNKTYPKTSNIVWFGNIYRQKTKNFVELKKKLNFDIVSFGHFNSIPIDEVKQNDRHRLKHILERYEVGIGVGKCAQELISLGLKVLVSGNNHSGFILNQNDFDFHIRQNCNSSISNSLGSIEKDLKYVLENKQTKINLPSSDNYLLFIKKLIQKL